MAQKQAQPLKFYTSDLISPLNQLGRMGKIRAVFDGSFNIRVRGQLIHMASYDGYIAPFGVTMDLTDYARILPFVDISNQVRITDSTLTFYSLRGVESFDYVTEDVDLKIQAVSLPQERMEDLIIAYRKATEGVAGLGMTIKDKAFLDWVRLLNDAEVSQDQWQQIVKYLVGRGPGLTPAGDDMLVGYLSILTMFTPERARELSEALTVDSLSTTEVSLAYLMSATQGHFSSPIHDLYKAVIEDGDLVEAIRRIIRIGHTSGKDMTYGIGLGLDYLLWNIILG